MSQFLSNLDFKKSKEFWVIYANDKQKLPNEFVVTVRANSFATCQHHKLIKKPFFLMSMTLSLRQNSKVKAKTHGKVISLKTLISGDSGIKIWKTKKVYGRETIL